MSGFFKSYRRAFDHPLFSGEQANRYSAWHWMIAQAAWKPTQHCIRGVMHDVPRGAFFVTVRELMGAWGWGNSKTSGFLKTLEKQDMIRCEIKTGKTLVTICNYDKYQDENSEARQPQDSRKTPARQPQDTKEEREELEEGNRARGRARPKRVSLSSRAMEQAENARKVANG